MEDVTENLMRLEIANAAVARQSKIWASNILYTAVKVHISTFEEDGRSEMRKLFK